MMFRSALYVGAVMHRRLRPVVHQFRYRAFWLLIDLDELPRLAARLRLFSCNRFNLFALHDARSWRRRRDAAARPGRAACCAQAGIDIAGGPISLFCMPRTLGYSFNPISIYFCHQPAGELAAIIYEVHNTFGERHSYVARQLRQRSGEIRQQLPQGVPCISVYGYGPGSTISGCPRLRSASQSGSTPAKAVERILNACLAGARRELTDGALLSSFLRSR